MYKAWLTVLLFVVHALFGVDPDVSILIDSASCNVRNAVHAPTGQLLLQKSDAIISGFEPIPISRTYLSENSSSLNWEGGWAMFPHDRFVLYDAKYGFCANIRDANGALVRLQSQKTDSQNLLPILDQYYAPPFGREISGRTDIRNWRLEINKSKKETLATLYLGDGGLRIYKYVHAANEQSCYTFLLREEVKPNGNRIVYAHDPSQRIAKISTWNPQKTKEHASVTFTYKGKKAKDHDCDLHGSDGTLLHYHFWRPEEAHLHNFFYFEELSGEGVVAEKALYDRGNNKTRGPFITALSVGEQPALQFTYYSQGHNRPGCGEPIFLKKATDWICDKVQDLQEPVGPEGAFVTTHSFHYETGITKVRDLLGNETHYHFDRHFRPEKIEFYTPKGLARTEQFQWEGPNLAEQTIQDPLEENSFTKRYKHDPQGNVTQETISGNLTGNGVTSYTVSYEYSSDGFNLPTLKREENGLTIRYTYKKGTDLLTEKTIADREKVLICHLYNYNEDNFLIEESRTSSSGEQKIIRYTPNQRSFPATIEERSKDALLQKRILHYNKQDQVEEEEIYDSNGIYRYSIEKSYQSKLLTSQTDPIGQKTSYRYNSRHQPRERSQEGALTEVFEYSSAGMVIQKTLSEHQGKELCSLDLGKGLSPFANPSDVQIQLFSYNELGIKSSETDPFGATTQFETDRFGFQYTIHIPDGGVIRRESDFLCRELFRKEANGDETHTRYNAVGSPISIQRADGSKESFTYFKNGPLQEQIDAENVSTRYEVDIFQRPLRKTIYSPKGQLLSEELSSYDPLHLCSQTDALGVETIYTYDSHGRKCSEERAGVKVDSYFDPLGRLERTVQDNLVVITERDLLDRVIEERKESLCGEVLYKRCFAYKDFGRLVEETREGLCPSDPGKGASSLATHFDSFGRTRKIVDPYGHTAVVSYGINPHATTTIDALGRKRIDTFNAMGHLSCREQQDLQGNTIALEEYFYNLGGVLTKQKSAIYEGTTLLKTIETDRTYGPLNRLEQLTEAANTPDARTTTYGYTKRGLLSETRKPSGVLLKNSYNELGFLTELQSSEGSVHYIYECNPLGWQLSATDCITGQKTVRTVDFYGNVLEERLANGLVVERTYDKQNRCTSIKYPDGTVVSKNYDPLYLREVSTAELVHRYIRYDLSGALVEEKLPHHCGATSYRLDRLGRLCEISSNYHNQTIGSFDPVGKVESLQTRLPSSKKNVSFSYNSLDQLIDDGAHHYSCDSHYNRLLQDQLPIQVNALNQLDSMDYSTDGNPFQKGGLDLSYDALDRLIAVDFLDGSRISYTYDPFHRRLTKIDGNQTTRFLYDGNNEIGFERKGVLSIRVLGETPQAEIGSAVAMRLDGSWYIPLHDLQGSVALLIDPNTKQAAEEYLYTPFGESSCATSQNPWRYLSKHTDDETGFIFFGRRYYDPAAGRFLTRDPKGYTDSCNLYAFALNNPFMQIDPYGLENESSQMTGDTFLSDAGMITIGTMKGAFSGGWNGFVHPIDSMGGIGNDLLFVGSCMANGNASMLSATWLSMDWEERMQFCSFQGARAAGICLAVSGLGELYQGARLGVMAVTTTGKALLQMAERWGAKSSVGNATIVETIVAKQLPNPALSIVWPPNHGFLHSGRACLVPGIRLDRFGSINGRFLALEQTPLLARSLPPNAPSVPYRVFQVIKPFEVQVGPAAPWFNQPGLGLQFRTDIQIQQLVNEEYLKIITEVLK